MAKAYSQDLRDRVIEAVEQERMSCRSAAGQFGVSESAAIKWLERCRRTGSRTPVGTGGHRPSVLKPHCEFLEAVRAAQPDITLEALSRRLAAGRAVKADTSMLNGSGDTIHNCRRCRGRPAGFVAGSEKRFPRKYVHQKSGPKPKVQGCRITYYGVHP
jgi:putative transposase